MEMAIIILLSVIISTAISVKITAERVRRFEKHLYEMCDINVEQCSQIKKVTLSSMEELIKKTGLDK